MSQRQDVEMLPRFTYMVQPGDTLSEIARRFHTSMELIVRSNPHIRSIHRIIAGDEIVIPIDFPLPEGILASRFQVLPNRFLGSYEVHIKYTRIGELVAWYLAALEEYGFDASMNESNPVDGITLRNESVLLGRISFSEGTSETASRVDIGLLFAGGEKEYEESVPAAFDSIMGTSGA